MAFGHCGVLHDIHSKIKFEQLVLMKNKCIISKFSILLIFLVFCGYAFINKKWQKEEVLKYDSLIYYTYLPATFIYHDLSLDFLSELPSTITNNIWYEKLSDNKKYLKMTSGVAILCSPFFLVAKNIHTSDGQNKSGFGSKFQLSIVVAALFYLLIGLIYLRKTLLLFFDDIVTSLVLVIVSLGTNLFYYTVFESGMSHVYSFSLVSVFLYYSIRWNHDDFNIKSLIILSIIGGLITLIRPLNGIICLFPIFYNKAGFNLLQKMKVILSKPSRVFLAFFCFLLPFLPQLVYWKIHCDTYLFYSYGQEQFFLDKPHVFEGLFGFRKGFFIYTPVMILLIPGLFISYKRMKNIFWAFSIVTAIFLYLTFSWWCWWYGGSFSARTLVDFYALFALVMGCFFSFIIRKKFYAIVCILFLLSSIGLNITQSFQLDKGFLHYDAMTFEAYKEIFLNLNEYKINENSLIHPNYEQSKRYGE